MNNLKKFILNNLIVLVILIIAALIGGFFGSYFTYRLNNLSTEKRNEEITKQLMFFIHNEIYENYIHITQWGGYEDESLLYVDGLELINLRGGNLTIKDKQLSFLVRIYVHFNVLNYKRNRSLASIGGGSSFEEYNKWRNICLKEIKDYEIEFCKGKSLKSEIEVE
ncbi:hypothetical protein ES705_17051 [subsurface metagenome]